MLLNTDDILNKALEDSPLSEDALALRFSERHTDNLRYVAAKDQWYEWDGTRWKPEKTMLVYDLIRAGVREDFASYSNGKPPEKGLTARTVSAIHWLARSDRRQAATVEQFDADPWLLTVEGATTDLRQGTSYDPDPADFITKKTACAIAPVGTPHPIWTKFLDRIFAGNNDLIGFVQRYIGYCLTGDTSEHRFVFGYGTGANGKGTLVNTIAQILADYSCIADVGTFLAANHERHPTDIAKLHGARFVIAQETEKGRKWDEVKIKSMTGGDKMTARFMRQDFFDFQPTFKLFITGNNKPQLENVDEAMRRRLLMVPFAVQIPPDERDPDLPKKLEAEWPAILRWCVDGCLAWQEIGLQPPEVVTKATDEYFSDQDVVRQWLSECTKNDMPTAFTPVAELYASWKSWCDDRSIHPGGINVLSDALVSREYRKKRIKGKGRGFCGIVLGQPDGADEETDF
jgi:putative DNA primase/helicase